MKFKVCLVLDVPRFLGSKEHNLVESLKCALYQEILDITIGKITVEKIPLVDETKVKKTELENGIGKGKEGMREIHNEISKINRKIHNLMVDRKEFCKKLDELKTKVKK